MRLFGMITTKSSAQYTELALQSFFNTTSLESEDKFILIDNDCTYNLSESNSTGPIELVRPSYPRGFAANGNFLLERAREYRADLYFTNNDVVFTPNWITPLLDGQDQILSPISNREFRYKSNLLDMNIVMGIADLDGKLDGLNKVAKEHSQRHAGFLKVIALPFFCVKIPLNVSKVVGNFDEEFGLAGGEDYDYCLRAYLAGFSVLYALPSFILHFGGKSSWDSGEEKTKHQQREDHFLRYFEKKWGKTLYHLAMTDDTSATSSDPFVTKMIKSQDFSQLIATLKKD